VQAPAYGHERTGTEGINGKAAKNVSAERVRWEGSSGRPSFNPTKAKMHGVWKFRRYQWEGSEERISGESTMARQQWTAIDEERPRLSTYIVSAKYILRL
jgi:hypothetical protein